MTLPSAKPTFSETWHRVAHLRIRLQPAMELVRQHYRGERWYVLRHRFGSEFFRLTPAAYTFLLRLEGRTVEETWRESLTHRPEETPTQDEAISLLAQLYRANLLLTSLPANTRELFARREDRRQRTWRARWRSLLAIQLPLWDPSDFLTHGRPWVRPLFSRGGALLWGLVVAAALKTALDHAGALQRQSEAVLAPENLFLLYGTLVVIKAVHELSHAFACRCLGGEVHKMGLLLLYLSPVPYVDASSSWGFRSKWERILVAAAGMLGELFVAALAVFCWAGTAPGTLHSVAYNVIFIASVTTVLFNANPLVRYDGYYIAADLLEVPNLAARAAAYLQYLAENYLFAVPQPSPARSRRERLILAVYGVAGPAYRVVLFSGIVLVVAKRYLLLGALMAVGCAVSFTVQPLWRLGRYLQQAPQLGRRRSRAVAIVVGGVVALGLGLGLVPFPRHFRAPGIVEAARWSEVHAGASGVVESVLRRSGDLVRAGEPLLRLHNPELELEVTAAAAEQREAQAELELARIRHREQTGAWQAKVSALEQRHARLEELHAALTVRAPQAGRWAGLHLEQLTGTWLPRGVAVGKVLDESAWEFSAVVPQAEAASLFTPGLARGEVRLFGQESTILPTGERRILPATQERLPSAALGWRAGGELAISATDPHGVRAAEPFFEVRSALPAASPGVLRHGRAGAIRFSLPPQPLLGQWERWLRQLFQKNFDS